MKVNNKVNKLATLCKYRTSRLDQNESKGGLGFDDKVYIGDSIEILVKQSLY